MKKYDYKEVIIDNLKDVWKPIQYIDVFNKLGEKGWKIGGMYVEDKNQFGEGCHTMGAPLMKVMNCIFVREKGGLNDTY